jgi:hypothetical protein
VVVASRRLDAAVSVDRSPLGATVVSGDASRPAAERGGLALSGGLVGRSRLWCALQMPSKKTIVVLRIVLATRMSVRIVRDSIRLGGEREASGRSRLRTDRSLWRRVLAGRLAQDAASGS